MCLQYIVAMTQHKVYTRLLSYVDSGAVRSRISAGFADSLTWDRIAWRGGGRSECEREQDEVYGGSRISDSENHTTGRRQLRSGR